MNTANAILNNLVERIKLELDQELIGIYLYGSMVHGDFDDRLSDIDLLIVTKHSIEGTNFDQLKDVHKQFNTDFPEWSNRIDLAYVSQESLKSFKSQAYIALTIHGEEELAKTNSEPHWLIDWYKVLHQSKVVYGPKPNDVIPDITKQEFRSAIKNYILGWPDETKPKTDPADLAYVVLALCRSMYAYAHCTNISKRQSAEWAENEFPQFAELIRNALILSRSQNITDKGNLIDRKEVLSFAEYICSRVR